MEKDLIIRDKSFMNTLITIKVIKEAETTVKILDAIEEAFGEFDRIVKAYTRFNENSELSNLNRMSGSWVKVSPEFFELTKKMLDLARKTDGAFDPTIIDFLEIYGYDKNYDFSKLENPELDQLVQNRAKTRPSWNEIELDPENIKIKLQNDQKIDLGGIGKGYAIDCAFEKIIKNQINNFLIDAGGDIRASGRNQKDNIWNVGLKHEDINGKQIVHSMINLNNKALACSGSWARKVKQFHHLINPLTGKPQNAFKTIYVQADTATAADGWATALFILGNEIDTSKLTSENIQFYTL